MSKQNFTHLILTRFNLKRLEGNPPARGWLERRFDLFDRFCYPSLHAQSNDNFTWLVFFDTDTPQAFRGRIEEYARWKKFIPVFTGSEIFFGFHFPPELRPTILNHIDDHCRFLITSRLDNDDAVHKDYVQMIQKSFDRQKLEAVNLLYGWQLYRKKLILCQIESNPFISLIEEFDESTIRTVYVRGHGMISQICPVKNIVNKTKPAWMQVIHYDNRVNRRMSGPQYPIRELMNGYEFYFDPDNVLKNKRLPELFDKTLQQIRMGGHFSRGAKRKAKKDPEKFRQFTEEFYKHTDSIDELRRLIRDFKKS